MMIVNDRLLAARNDGLFTFPLSTLNTGRDDFQARKEFRLEQNYPNPFNPTTTIQYQLPNPSDVRLEVFDVLGRKAATLVNQRQSAGNYSVNLNASMLNLSSGIYFYRLQSGSFIETKKMTLVK